MMLWNPSWHLEQGGGGQGSSEIGELNEEAHGRVGQEPRRATQNNYEEIEARLPQLFFPNSSCTW